jgi:two-component system, LytTR family, response regulator
MSKELFTCLIIDDEPHIIETITGFINKTDYLRVKDSTTQPDNAMALLEKERYDIVFCDIKMPDISGLEIVETHKGKAAFIMSTAYAEYAINGFELGVVDYLLKPFNYTRFITAVQKAISLINAKHKITEQKTNDDHIFVKGNFKGKLEKVDFNEVDYVEGRKNYIAFVGNDNEITTLMNMKDIETQLVAFNFLRVHLSYIVKLSKIERLEGNALFLKGHKGHIPIGITYKQSLLDKLKVSKL